MNGELLEGMCDGTYKRIVMERSNRKDHDRILTVSDRLNLNKGYGGYGIFESPHKQTGDGRFCQ
jgi:hypothetical protein